MTNASERPALSQGGIPKELPRLPRSFYRRSTLGGLGFLVVVFALWWIPAGGAYYLMTQSDLPIWAKCILIIPLWFCCGQAIQLTGFVGHEGFHFSLFPNRYVGAVVGIVVSSATVVFLQAGVAIDHFNHHRYTNQEKDPDMRLFGRQRGTWARILLTRARANRAFFLDVMRLVTNRPLNMDERKLPFGRPVYRRLAILNLACAGAWLVAYILLGIHDSAAALCFVVGPLVFGSIYSGLRPYLEHNNTDTGKTTCARSRTHGLITAFYYGNNLHLEHHLYPSVPCYRLSRVHRWLVDNGHLPPDHPGFDPSLLASYRHVGSSYAYGMPHATKTYAEERRDPVLSRLGQNP